jgi:hypothetical protein
MNTAGIGASKGRGRDGSQRLRSLDRADRVRMTRSRVKRRIATGELTAAEVILTARWEIERMPIAEVLGSQPQWGAARCHRFLAAVRIGETKTIGSMTKRQRLATAAELNRDRPLSKPHVMS